MPRFRRFSLKLLVLLSLTTCCIGIGSAWLVYAVARANQMESIRRKITTLASTAAEFIDREAYQRLIREGNHGDADWRRIAATLELFRHNDPDLRFIYTLSLRPDTRETGRLQFVVDPMPERDWDGDGVLDGPERAARLGEVYEAGLISPPMLAAFDGPTCEVELATDRWGTTLSGYAPIRTGQGEAIGIVGVDIAAEQLAAIRQAFLWQCAIVFATVVLTALLISWLLTRHINRPVAALHAGLQRVRQGDYSQPVLVQTGDEFQQLAEDFNSMREAVREREFARSTLECYLSTDVAREVFRHGPDFYKKSERRRITVVFVDLVGMTALAEQRSPEQVARILDVYFNHMINAVIEHGGMVNKLLGDGLMALFGAPMPLERHELQAVRAARAMQLAMGEVRARTGLPKLSLSIGIHSGEAVLGNIGTDRRLEYTAVGDTVNVAARLEKHTREAGLPILLSQSVAQALDGAVPLRALGPVNLRGRDLPVDLFTIA